jgi:hypothetical protein
MSSFKTQLIYGETVINTRGYKYWTDQEMNVLKVLYYHFEDDFTSIAN